MYSTKQSPFLVGKGLAFYLPVDIFQQLQRQPIPRE
jgi:hypothetical protein